MEARSGLYALSSRDLLPLPLQSANVDVSVYDLCAEVKVSHTYNFQAPSSSVFGDGGLECIFVFPLDEESAVFSFSCNLDGKVVQAKIQEKSQARAAYSRAVRSNKSAMLLEQLAENVFTCRVGRLLAGSTCITTISYLTLLDQEGRCNRLTLPLTIAPKYTPLGHSPPYDTNPFWEAAKAPKLTVQTGYGCASCLSTPIIGPRFHCNACSNYDLCDACHNSIRHPHALEQIADIASPHASTSEMPTLAMPSVQTTLESLTIKIYACMPSPVVSIRTPSHPENTHIDQQQQETNTTAMALFRSECAFLSKDFILLIEQEACFDPRVLCELDVVNHSAAVSLAILPRPLDMISRNLLQFDLVFVIDCSGSMSGSSIACVRDCMQILLRSLPVNSLFNIITFGSRWSSLFPSSSLYDDKTLRVATKHVAKLEADLGGTEMYPPLLYALSNEPRPNHPRQVFLLTDAEVTNADELVHLVLKHATNSRLFTFGIGDYTDRSLCKRLAHAGRGKCEFVSMDDSSGGDLRGKVFRQVGRAMQPALTDVNVDWKNLANSEKEEGGAMLIDGEKRTPNSLSSFLQCPSKAPAIFVNNRFVLHALNVCLPDMVWQQVAAGQHPISLHEKIKVTAQSNSPNGLDLIQTTVSLSGQQVTQATVIHTLAARARIKELEDLIVSLSDASVKKELESEIVALSLKFSLASSKASFVAVYENGDVKADAFQRGLSYANLESCSYGEKRAARFGYCSDEEECASEEYGDEFSGEDECELECASLSVCPESAQLESSLITDVSFGKSSKRKRSKSTDPQWEAFQNLINLQSANGAWDITSKLIHIISSIVSSSSMTMKALRALCTTHGVSRQVVATLAALLILSTHYKEKESDWELIAMKSQFYLAKTANIEKKRQDLVTEDIKKLGF